MIFAILVAIIATTWVLSHPRETAKLLAKLLGKDLQIVPALIKYRITTKCNSKCNFCSHRVKTTSHVQSLDNIKRGLLLLKQAGMKRIVFTGGEPLMHPSLLIDAVIYCKEELGLRSVSVVTNGSLLTGHFIFRTAQSLDSITVACDMFDPLQGNGHFCCGSGGHPRRMEQASRLCRLYVIKFKINTLVNQYNVDQDMNAHIRDLQPFRWNCSPVLIGDQDQGQDDEYDDDNDAADDDDSEAAVAAVTCITDEEFRHFRMRHRHNKHFTATRKKTVKGRYLLLDEYMQILDEETGVSSQSILEVGVERALDEMR